jgi:long-chain-alcohol oxidase
MNGVATEARAMRFLAAVARGSLGDAYRPEVPGWMAEIMERLPAGDRTDLIRAAVALDTRAGALVLSGRPTPMSWLTPGEVEVVLERWKRSRVPVRRKLAGAFTALAAAANYGHPGPLWEAIGYGMPAGVRGPPRRLSPVRIEREEVLDCDAVVVGSGAGGACVAARLAGEGHDVVVLEKGGYRTEGDFTQMESDAHRNMYLYASALSTADLGVRIISGSTLGGGTVVNFSTSFRTPDHVLKEWRRISGIEAFASGEFESSLDEVEARLGVNRDSSAAGKRDELLEDGLKKLGWQVDSMPRAVRGCSQDEACGYCGFGCRIGAKQSALVTYLEDAASAGARLVVNADVRRVLIDEGRALGVESWSGGHKVTINARAVVVAAGAIETPALLLRSGLKGEVGRELHLHPGTAPVGIFDEDVRPWEGTLQARYSHEFRDWDGNYGPIFETIPLHPGTAAAFIPWTSSSDHADRMKDLARTSFCGVLMRDRSAGRICLGRDGSPRITYRLNGNDERRVGEAVILAARVLEAAGARRIISPHTTPLVYEPSTAGAHERWADQTRAVGYRGGRVTFGSWHQMGSCRMGSNPSTSVVDADNQSHEVQGLYVTDSSAFPSATGVNPMISVYGIANRAAKTIAARLG